MTYSVNQAQATLAYVSKMSLAGSLVKRYLINPHVTRKDSVHEHIARITRLATVVLPNLRAEFAHQADVSEALQHLQTIVCIHDDEEILDQGGDIATFAKTHDANNEREIEIVKANLAQLTSIEREYVITYFTAFRKRKELTGAMRFVATIAKVLDNIVGNQIAIEDVVGMIQPDYVVSCIRYVDDYSGLTCKTVDALIQAQIRDIEDIRERIKTDGTVERLATQWTQEGKGAKNLLTLKIQQQLSVDIKKHTYSKEKSYVPVWEYVL